MSSSSPGRVQVRRALKRRRGRGLVFVEPKSVASPRCVELPRLAIAVLAQQRLPGAVARQGAEGLRSSRRAGCHRPDVLGGQRATADPPIATGDLLDDHPVQIPQRLTLDRDHSLGQLLDHLALLLGGKGSLDHRRGAPTAPGRWKAIDLGEAIAYALGPLLAQPLSPVVEIPSSSSRWKARKNPKVGTRASTDMANSCPGCCTPVVSRKARSATGTVNESIPFR